jgi:hypothetical protein
LLSAVAKALGMYYFSDRYRQRVGSYRIFFLFFNYLPLSCQYNRDAPKLPPKNSTLLKLQPLYPTNLKKEKGFFFSFRFRTPSHRLRHIARISDSAMRA